jgi:PAS domain S-box-containing protein
METPSPDVREDIATLTKPGQHADLETILRALVDNPFDGVIFFDSKENVISANKSAESIFGRESTEWSGMRVNDLVSSMKPQGSDCLLSQWAKRILQGESNCEVQGLHKNGGTLALSIAVNAVELGGQSLYICHIRDISKKKELLEAQERYHRLENNLQDYFVYSQAINGVFTDVSSSITEILGYTQEEFQTHYAEYLTDHPANQHVKERL